MNSLSYQADRHVEVEPPSNLPEVMRRVVLMYPKSKIPTGFSVNGVDWQTIRQVARMRALLEVQPDSGPGVPLNRLAGENEALLEKYLDNVVDAVVARLQLLAFVDEKILHEMDPVELVERGFCDPIRLFVKNEGHDEAKLSSGRVRLISSVSIVDQIVERILSTSQNNAEKADWKTNPTKVGIGFSDDDNMFMWKDISKRGPRAQSDISGFDWSVQYWELLADAQMRIELNGSDPNGVFARCLRNRVRCLATSLFALPDGTLIAQSLPALQKSGSYNTSPTNSRIRVMLAVAVGADWAIAAGDDCIEQYVPGSQANYGRLGRICKFYDRCEDDSFVFCSRKYTATSAVPVNWLKGLFNLLIDREQRITKFEDYIREYRDCEMFLHCVGVVAASGWGGSKF